MARASYIYVVQGPTGKVLGVFTVKHEMISALARCEFPMETITVERYPDGAYQSTVGEMTRVTDISEEVRRLVNEEREYQEQRRAQMEEDKRILRTDWGKSKNVASYDAPEWITDISGMDN